jgi:HEAT repeat protein
MQRAFPPPPERSEDMPPSQSRLTLVLCLMFLTGLAGCGQASSDNAPSLESRASVSGSTLSKQGQSRGNNSLTPVTQAASPVPLASVNGAGSASGTGTVQGGDSPQAVPAPSSEPGHPIEGLVVPDLMAQKLNSPNVRVRLRALEAWAREAPLGAVDPFILAFEDKDERVRARAQQLIEQDWARKAEVEKSGERGER